MPTGDNSGPHWNYSSAPQELLQGSTEKPQDLTEILSLGTCWASPHSTEKHPPPQEILQGLTGITPEPHRNYSRGDAGCMNMDAVPYQGMPAPRSRSRCPGRRKSTSFFVGWTTTTYLQRLGLAQILHSAAECDSHALVPTACWPSPGRRMQHVCHPSEVV